MTLDNTNHPSQKSQASLKENRLAAARLIDSFCDEFEGAWKSGERPNVHLYLDRAPSSLREALFAELLAAELEIRSKAGDIPSLDEYVPLFDGMEQQVREVFDQLGACPNDDAAETRSSIEKTAIHRFAIDRDASLPCLFGEYELLKVLGRGGMGVVYQARQESAGGRFVAIKLIRPDHLAMLGPKEQADLLARFRREVAAAAKLEHDHVVTVYDVGELDGQSYFSMRYVDGNSLREKLHHGPIEPRLAARYCQQIASALAHAHAVGILHRDLKPHNVMLDERLDRALLADFGLARLVEEDQQLTATADVMGSPPYMSPEQTRDMTKVTELSDIYSLGATLYHLLVGRPPFQAASPAATMLQIQREDPVSPRVLNPAVPLDLETITLKCLSKEPDQRYACAADLADELDRHLRGEAILARPEGTPARVVRWCRRNPLVATLTAVVLLVLFCGATISTTFALIASQRLDEIDQKNTELTQSNRDLKVARDNSDQQSLRAEKRLLDMHESMGTTVALRDNSPESLLWFAEAAKSSINNLTRSKVNQIRYRNWMRYVPVPIQAFRNKIGVIEHVEISPNNTHALLHRRDGIILWDLRSNEPTSYPRHRATFGPLRDMLALSSPDGQVKLLTLPDLKVRQQFEVSAEGAPQLAFSPDESRLAVGYQDVSVWDLTKSDFILGKASHSSPIHSLAITQDSNLLITSSLDMTSSVFNLAEHKLDEQSRFPPIRHTLITNGIGCALIPPLVVSENQALFRADNVTLQLVNLLSGKTVREFRLSLKGVIADAALSNDKTQLALSMDPSGEVECFNVETGALLFREHSSPDRVPRLAFQPGTGVLAIASYTSSIRFFDMANGAIAYSTLFNQGRSEIVNFSEDGRLLITVQNDQTIKLFQMPLANHGPDAEASFPRRVPHEPSLSSSGRYLVSPGDIWSHELTKAVHVVRTQSMAPASSELPIDDGLLLSTAMSPDEKCVAMLVSEPGLNIFHQYSEQAQYYARAGRVQQWNWRSGKLIGNLSTKSLPLDVAYSPDGSELAVICGQGELLRVDGKTTEVLHSSRLEGRPAFAFQRRTRMLRYSPSGDLLCTMGFGPSLCLWDRDGQLVAKLANESHVNDAQFSTDGAFLVTATEKGIVTVWDTKTGAPTGKPLLHSSVVRQARFNKKGDCVATACDDRLARIWQWRTGKLVCRALEHEYPVRTVFFSADDSSLISSSAERTWFWDINSGRPLAPPRSLSLGEAVSVVDSKGQRIVGRRQMLEMRELSPLSDDWLGKIDLKQTAEVLSGRRIAENGSVILTGDEWLERWHELKESGTLTKVLSELQNESGLSVRRRLNAAVQSRDWEQAHSILARAMDAHLKDPHLLPLACQILLNRSKYEDANIRMNNFAKIVDKQEVRLSFGPISKIISHPRLAESANALIIALCQSSIPDNRLVGLELLRHFNSADASLIAITLAATSDADEQIAWAALNATARRLFEDRTGAWKEAIEGLPADARSDLREALEANFPLCRITEPAVQALVSSEGNWEWARPAPMKESVRSAKPENAGELSEDGLRFYFSSDQGSGSGLADLWLASRDSTESPFDTFENLGDVVNSSFNEVDVAISGDELTIVFSSNRDNGEGAQDLWMSSRATRNIPFGPPINLGTRINSPARESSPSISENGLSLVFVSDRAGSPDLYWARRENLEAPFESASRLSGPVNTPQSEDDPTILMNGKYLLFRSGRTGSPKHLYLSIWSDAMKSFQGRYPLVDALQSPEIERTPKLQSGQNTLTFASTGSKLFGDQFPNGKNSLVLWQSKLIPRPSQREDKQ